MIAGYSGIWARLAVNTGSLPRLGENGIAIGFARLASIVPMVFTKRLRAGVGHGAITCSIRIWTRPKVKVGARYRMEEGEIEVDSIEEIRLRDLTHEFAIESGFLGVSDLLKVAKHGPGDNVYLVRFHYIPPF